MILAETYKTGIAFWRAIQDRSKTLAKAEGRNHEAIQKQFVRERLLARVFQEDSVHWVLKAASALNCPDTVWTITLGRNAGGSNERHG